jgi:hypothetical protein
MSSVVHMLSVVNEFNEFKARLTREVEAYCQDNTIPLDQRWEVFVESKLGSTDGSATGSEALDKIYGGECSLYDDLGKDRYSTVNMIDEINNLEESSWCPSFFVDDPTFFSEAETEEEYITELQTGDYTANFYPTRKLINELKEEILQSFILSFVNDW